MIAAKAVDGDFVAVDFIPYKGKPYFLEVNSSFGERQMGLKMQTLV